jgi:endoglucanase
MSPGWNLGNSLEAYAGGTLPKTSSQETYWGNPAVNQAIMNGIAQAGFKSVRIPVSWAQYADSNNVIAPFWLARVRQVVDMARRAGLYVVLNEHWDGGWLEPTYAAQTTASPKLAELWRQIATYFRYYDNHLIFAGTNEVTMNWQAPTAENCAVQRGYNQMFVSAVRKTGGNNATRTLVVQTYATNIDFGISCNMQMPVDTATRRLMVEVHYYDPYDFTLNTDSAIWQWGKDATSPANTETWANEAYADNQFQKMQTYFINRGIPVILGEYAASLRTEYDPSQKYRNYWDQYITQSARQHGLVPMYWDNGYLTNHQSGLFDRSTGNQGYPATLIGIVTSNSAAAARPMKYQSLTPSLPTRRREMRSSRANPLNHGEIIP